jgi:transcriptional regulator with XRE-family HTH domain
MSGGTTLTPGERRARDSARGRYAYDALLARFEQEVDPDGTLDSAERTRRAEQARSAHFREIGQRGAAATAQSRRAERPPRAAPVQAADGPRADREPNPADWAHLWEQPDLRAALSARDVGAAYQALKAIGVSQRQIAQLTGQNQPEVSEILHGRQVRDVTVLERVCDGLGIPRPAMRLLDKAPGDGDAYREELTVADPAKGDEMLRRDLIAQGTIALVGGPVLGALLGADAVGPGLGPLPSRVGMADVAEIATTTEQLRAAARAYGGQARAVTAAALEYGRLLQVPPASDVVAAALGSRLAELAELAGWCWHDSGDDQTARWHYREAAGLAREAGDDARLAIVLMFAGIIDAVRGRPDDALKVQQIGLEILQRARAGPEAITRMRGTMAYDFAVMGRHDQAAEHLARARDGWSPTSPYVRADVDYQSALVQVECGRLDVAEALAAGVNGGGQHRPVGVLAGVLRATIHVQTGEPRGLTMAHDVIRAVAPMRSVRARQKLAPLVQALESRPSSDAQDLARTARQLAA